jgi:predicted nucleic acid-binding protein
MDAQVGREREMSSADPAMRVLERPPSMRRHPVVVDANVLIEDVLRYARTGASTLTFLGEQEVAVLLAPTHIGAKVRQHLPRVAAQTDCPLDKALEAWEGVHARLLRLVDLPPSITDERAMVVASKDPEDGPLAQLAALVAPAVVLTRDKHLTRAGIGQADWLSTVLVLSELARIEESLWNGSRAFYLSLFLPARAIFAICQQVARSEVATGLVLGLAVGAALFLRQELKDKAINGWRRVEPGLANLAELAAEKFEEHARASSSLDSRLVLPVGPPTPDIVLARLLAERGRMMTSEALHGELCRAGFTVSVAQTRQMLASRPQFVGVPGRGYQLGRALPGR